MAHPRSPRQRPQATRRKPAREKIEKVSKFLIAPSAFVLATAVTANNLIDSSGHPPDDAPEPVPENGEQLRQAEAPQQDLNYIDRDASGDRNVSADMNTAARAATNDAANAATVPSSDLSEHARQELEDIKEKPGHDDPRAQIRAACMGTGVDPDIAITIAHAESSLRHDVSANGSSGRGYFQFVFNTFKEYVHNYAAEIGYPDIADMVERVTTQNNGKYHFSYKLADGVSQYEFMQHAENGHLNAALACRKIAADMETIQNDLGLEPTATNIYVMHFLGHGHGQKMLELYHKYKHHNHAPRDYFGDHVIKSNSTIFRDGERDLDIASVWNRLSNKISRSQRTLGVQSYTTTAHNSASPN